MPNEQNPIVAPADNVVPKRRGFAPGHAKVGGRKKDVPTRTWLAREIAEKHSFHPLEEIIRIYQTGKLPTVAGTPAQSASASDRVRLLEVALSFLLPRLSSQQITGANDGPIAVATLDVTKLMENPDMAAMAQKLSLAMSGYPTTPQLESGEDQ